MSRFSYDNDNEPWQAAMWAGRVKQVMSGRPALASFRKLEAALLALPEHRLIDDQVCENGEVCAIGALALHQRVLAGESRADVLEDLERQYLDEGEWETAWLGHKYGLTETLAWIIAEWNDESLKAFTQEGRYDTILQYTRQHIARLEAKFAR